jgi:hypothetical protein
MRFFRGIPTKVDVDALVAAIGVPEAGTEIKHDDIAKIINQPVRSYRYCTVVSAWRKRLERENNVLLQALTGVGYVSLNASGRVAVAASKYKCSLRQVERSGKIAAKTDRKTLTDEEKRACDHIQNTSAALRMAADKAARAIVWNDKTGN